MIQGPLLVVLILLVGAALCLLLLVMVRHRHRGVLQSLELLGDKCVGQS